MRGLGIRAAQVLKAGGTAVAALAAIGLFLGALTACSAGGTGARDEGPARSDPGASAAPKAVSSSPASPAPKQVNAVRLVKDDPSVSTEVKRDLKPCVGDEYPVDVSYGKLTGNTSNDVVVNVMTCGDAVSIGSYVYRDTGGRYENVFMAEEPPVYAEIDRGDLVVTKQVYEKGDSVAYPSGEDVLTYRWTTGRFVEQDRTHNDYSNAVNGDTPEPSDN
ncbi:hypothetical protein [Streptomyces sp. NBC_01445]|uniref:hypothetical protein n=1 Tax=Streptomyces sp. NBC_01445 TaxID=2903869 RepID=UPI002DDBA2DF|nr:hypothetical protein [Streptomyces sp. NBC_01445]WSE05871.1 hypothetical protein OG574_22420 [Streptomyces sp. NBC_01445]